MASNAKTPKKTPKLTDDRGTIIASSVTKAVRHTMICMADLMEPSERGALITGRHLHCLQEAWAMLKLLTPAFEKTLPSCWEDDETF